MPKLKVPLTPRGLRIKERRINHEITTYNLALDRLENTGIDNPNRSISDPFTLLELEIYNAIHARLDTALRKRRVVRTAMRELGIEHRDAALDNRR